MGMLLNKPSAELLIDLINSTNKTRFQPADLNVTRPQPATLEGYSFVNSMVVATGTGTTAYQGPEQLHYRRVDLELLLLTKNRVFTIDNGGADFTMADLLPQINARYGLALSLDDVINGSWSQSATDEVDVILEARSQSYVYIGASLLKVAPFDDGGEVEPPVDSGDNDFEMASTSVFFDPNGSSNGDTVQRLAPNSFRWSAPTAYGPSYGPSYGPVNWLDPQTDPIDWTLGGFVADTELVNTRKYGMPNGNSYVWPWPEAARPTAISFDTTFQVPIDGGFQYSIYVSGMGLYQQPLSEALQAQLSGHQQTEQDMESGTQQVFSTNIPLTAGIASLSVEVQPIRMDTRTRSYATFTQMAQSYVTAYEATGAQRYLGDVTPTADGLEFTDLPDGVLLSVEREGDDWRLVGEGLAGLRLYLTPPYESDAGFHLTYQGGNAQLLMADYEGNAMSLLVRPGDEAGTEMVGGPLFLYIADGSFDILLHIAKATPLAGEDEQRRTLDFTFSNMRLTGVGDQGYAKSVSEFLPMRSCLWDLGDHGRTIVGGYAGHHSLKPGLFLLADSLELYVETLDVTMGPNGLESTLLKGWYPVLEHLTTLQDAPLPSELTYLPGPRSMATQQGSFIIGRAAVLTTTGAIGDKAYASGVPQWVYYPRIGPERGGEVSLDLMDGVLMQFSSELVNGAVGLQLNSLYNDQTYHTEITLADHGLTVLDRMVIVSPVNRAAEALLYSRANEQGQALLVKYDFDGVVAGYDVIDLPHAGAVTIHRVAQINRNVDRSAILAYFDGGEILACTDYGTGVTPVWEPVYGGDSGELGSEGFYPIALSADGSTLHAYMDTQAPAPQDRWAFHYDMGDEILSNGVGVYTLLGDPVPWNSQPQWNLPVLSPTFGRLSSTVDLTVPGVMWSVDGRTAWTFMGSRMVASGVIEV